MAVSVRMTSAQAIIAIVALEELARKFEEAVEVDDASDWTVEHMSKWAVEHREIADLIRASPRIATLSCPHCDRETTQPNLSAGECLAEHRRS